MKVGAVVQLKSGGLSMTVIALEDGMARCQWQNIKTGEVKEGVFPIEALNVEEEEDEGAIDRDPYDDGYGNIY